MFYHLGEEKTTGSQWSPMLEQRAVSEGWEGQSGRRRGIVYSGRASVYKHYSSIFPEGIGDGSPSRFSTTHWRLVFVGGRKSWAAP